MTDLFTFDAYALRVALTACKPAISSPRYGGLPVLTCVRVDAGADRTTVTATDLDVTVTRNLPGTDAPASACIPHAALLAATAGATARKTFTLTVTVDDDMAVTMAGSNGSTTATAVPVIEWPNPVDMGDAATVTVDTAPIAAVLPAAVSADTARPILFAVLIGDGRAVATDSYMLSLRTDGPDLGDGVTVLVPVPACQRIIELGESVAFTFTGRHCHAVSDTGSVTARLVDGEFPSYRGLIPDPVDSGVTVDRAQLLDVVKAHKTFGKARKGRRGTGDAPTRFNLDSAGVVTVTTHTDAGSMVTPLAGAVFTDDLLAAYSAAYVVDMLTTVTSDRVHLEIRDAQKPAVIRDGATVNLLMPKRVQ